MLKWADGPRSGCGRSHDNVAQSSDTRQVALASRFRLVTISPDATHKESLPLGQAEWGEGEITFE